MANEVQTPRRSKRFQPLVLDRSELPGFTDSSTSWIGEPLLTRKTKAFDVDDEDSFDEDEDSETTFYNGFTRRSKSSKKRKQQPDSEYYIGDTVLVKTHAKLPSIGVIVAMWEVRSADNFVYEKVKVHWFLRPTELPNIRARRGHEQGEIYFSLASTATLSPNSILGHCFVTSKSSEKSKHADNQFYCISAIDALRGLYYELSWEAHRESSLRCEDDEDGSCWVVVASSSSGKTSTSKKTVKLAERNEDSSDEDVESDEEYQAGKEEAEDEDEDEEGEEVEGIIDDDKEDDRDDEDDALIPRTPSKKRKRAGQQKTPRQRKRQRRTIAAPTPHSKAALRARAKTKRLPTRAPADMTLEFLRAEVGSLPDDPWLRTMQVLHVGVRPEVLPCRENEFMHILRSVEGLLEEGSGGCVYVSGVPGTGKTATVHRIVRELKRMAERNEANPFTYVEINGLRIPEPTAAYSLLWEAVSGHDVASDGHLKISSKEALKQLAKFFGSRSGTGPAGHACIVLMDELDQLLTTKQEVVYNFFNWPTLVGSKLIVIAVANTHDLPERVMSGRVRSRLGMTRINYQPYDKAQLVKIVNARLDAAKESFKGTFPEVLSPDAITFAAAKVASISGDARRVLDICRRAVELVRPNNKAARLAEVKKVITLMQSSHTAAYIEDCSLHERIMLAALLKCVKREGVDEIRWDNLQRQHLMYTESLTSGSDSSRKPTVGELRMILDSLLAAHALVAEDISASTGRQGEGECRVMLNLEQSEVQRVLGDIGGQRWKTALGL